VAGVAAADGLVLSSVGGAAGIAGGGAGNAFDVLEDGLNAPEAAAGEDQAFLAFRGREAVVEADDDIGSAQPTTAATFADRMAIIGEYEDDIGGEFADLDAELAAEAPDEPAGKGKRRMFRRRAKGTTAARR
jgi:hypothetical protein